ncbi:MmcQ/YjbR family DNA-binding protein [Stakelama sp. CBK3Z-3]|uniref:MmcQ/YjbR family DNA-binding protein n=1 Tax=Stakelama flava TaxID=2860338 RepID=A0ABS6XL45_9SPHN|nr:MmcQ/YjbR family DNA-binding protein [Stakelama flava]MBW4330923.1 MmcQ/YjbR family DNA-binding protein [Stakelama flava]
MTPEAQTIAEKLRPLCLDLPETCETSLDGMPAFGIEEDRIFARLSDRDGRIAVVVKVSDSDERAMLIAKHPDRYHDVAQAGSDDWVALRLDGPDIDWAQVADRIAASWELVAPIHLLEAGGR